MDQNLYNRVLKTKTQFTKKNRLRADRTTRLKSSNVAFKKEENLTMQNVLDLSQFN